MRRVDLRSDTVTRPSPGMRQAMAAAVVGDDVLGDDPTVLHLQQHVADLLGHEASLFVPSGTMANQIAIRCTCEQGDEIICDDATHSFHYEAGGPAALSGVSIRTLQGERGIFTAEQVAAAVRASDDHFPVSRMVIIENSNNRGGGSVWQLDQIDAIRAVCDQHGLHLHLDGARLLNAATALKCAPHEIAGRFDSVAMCFSKGLGAPVGSIVAGSSAFIRRAHRFRKMFGGGMRQVGILAAAAYYALENHRAGLAADHAHARYLAEALAGMPGIDLDPATVVTNIIMFDLDPAAMTAAAFVERMAAEGVDLFDIARQRLRMVTHRDVSAEQIEETIAAVRRVCAAVGSVDE